MSASKRAILLQSLNIAAFILTAVVNGLASTVTLNGRTTAEVSDLYPTLVTPAGYVFSIWGIIYALLLVFVVFQALPSKREQMFLGKISFLFILSSVLNVSWLLLWHYDQIALSVVLMFALLATLIAIYLRLGIGKSTVSWKEKACVHLPFSVYLGWITVASIGNVAAALVSVQWNGFGLTGDKWGALVIAVALLITLTVIATRKDVAYGLVLIWALVGIAVKQSAHPDVAVTAEVSAVIIAIALVTTVIVSRLKR